LRTIEWKDKSALLVFTGAVDFKELRSAGDAFYGDARLESIDYLLVDFRQADFSNLLEDDANSIVVFDSVASTYKPILKMAFLIESELHRLICEAYIAFSKTLFDTWDYKIFEDPAKAQIWCDN